MKKYIVLFVLLSGLVKAAVHINPAGLGEVLLLPYYTTNNDLNTLVTVSNTTDQAKAVKIVFREGKSDLHKLAMNLYLAPKDVWSFGLVNNGGTDADVISNDLSCAPNFTSPRMLSDPLADPQPPNGFGFAEGMIEIYEMGELDPSYGYGEAVTFEDGEPKNCQQIIDNWGLDGEWSTSQGQSQMLPVAGGLMASVALINVANGINYSYDAIALNDFYPEGQINHTRPSSGFLTLADADDTSMVLYQGSPIITQWTTGIEAVSAVLSQQQLLLDYSNELSVNAQTEVVLSFPTKKGHLYNTVIEPFEFMEFSEGLCELFSPAIFDRESQGASYVPGSVSPRPPLLCESVNVIKIWDFYDSESVYYPILDSENRINQSIFAGKAGMYEIQFNQTTSNGQSVDGTEVHTYHGLPVWGLVLTSYTNANAQPGLLAQYGGTHVPKSRQKIVVTQNQD